MEPLWSPVVAGQLLLGDAAARLEDDEVSGDVGEVMRVKQPQQSDLELAVFALGRGRLLMRPGVLPLGVARDAATAGRRDAEAEAIRGDADGGVALELGRVGP